MSPALWPTWDCPTRPWVLHSTVTLGALTEGWIETQAVPTPAYDARILGLRPASGTASQPHWYVGNEAVLAYVAHRGMRPTTGWSLALLTRAFRDSPPAVLHVHFGTSSALHLRLAGRLDVPLIAGFYGFDASMHKIIRSPTWRRRYNRLFACAERIVAEGPAMANRIHALGCPADKISVIRLPADADKLIGIERNPPDAFVVAAGGRWEEKKGFDTAIRAFARSLRGTDAKLRLIGGGPCERHYRTLVRDEGIQAQVEWTGRLPFRAFMKALASSSVALFPSRSARNGDSDGGAPVTLIEAQWLGVPVVVSDHDDLPFVTAPGGGIVVPPNDVATWAAALRNAFEDPSRLAHLATRCQSFVRQEHSPAATSFVRESLYNAAAGRAGEARSIRPNRHPNHSKPQRSRQNGPR